jgi:LuxR family maltose regulon positive regulatory protein
VLSSLLSTKLYFPPARTNLVRRPRLVERLQAGIQSPLTLISAPAGYGKTMLLSEWHAGPGARTPAAWLALDAADNDLVCFLQYFFAALDSILPERMHRVLPQLDSPDPLQTEAILTLLVNEFSEVSHDIVVVLDDYHNIKNQAVYNAVTFLVNHLPQRMHLVILTRADPALPLARLRAHKQLTEIRAEDLRFNSKETAEFLNRVMGLNLTVAQVAALERRSEGWIAGLQLAALSLQTRADVQGFISAFTGNHHYIVDYLAEEVLDRQPEPVRDFLLKTSILDRLSGSLCNALTGRADGQATLEMLAHSNLFLIPLDDERYWFRYHHLFADLLRNQLSKEKKAMIPHLHTLASQWMEENGFLHEAIDHAQLTGNDNLFARLISDYFFRVVREHRLPSFIRWMEALPDAVICKIPRLCLVKTYIMGVLGKQSLVEYYIQTAEKALGQWVETGQISPNSPEYAALLGEIRANQAGIAALHHNNPALANTLANQALAILPDNAHFARSLAAMRLCDIYFQLGQMPNALEVCSQAIHHAKLSDHPGSVVDAYTSLGKILKTCGRLQQAVQEFNHCLAFSESRAEANIPVYGIAHYGLAEVLFELGRLEEAKEHQRRGLSLCKQGGRVMETMQGFLLQAQFCSRQRDWHGCISALEQITEIEQETGISLAAEEAHYYQALASAYLGEPQLAQKWLEMEQTVDQNASSNQVLYFLRSAHLLIALKQLDQAQALLMQIESVILKRNCDGWVTEILAMQSIIHQKLGDVPRAFLSLEQALTLAEPEGNLFIFLAEGQTMLDLLHLARSKGIKPEFTGKLLSAAVKGQSPAPIQGQPLAMLLTKRELELLSLIAAGRSNKEIASELFISLGTVKRHTVNIFNKLDVKNRTEAVAKARQLRVLL